MTVTRIQPDQVETHRFDWGTMKWFVSPVTIPGAADSQGEVIYVISGTGTQTVGDEEFPIARATRSTSR